MNTAQRIAFPSSSRTLWTAVCVALLLVAAVPAHGEGKPKADAEAGADGRTVNVYLGTSRVIKSPWPVARVSITSPDVADVNVLTPDQVLVLGKSVGSTDLILWSKDERIWRSQVEVNADIRRLEADLGVIFPDCKLDLVQSGESVIVQGQVARQEQAAQLRQLLEAKRLKYLDMTTLAGVQQVQIHVRVAEVSRAAIRTLGINAFMTGSDMFGASTVGAGAPINPISIGVPAGTSAAQSGLPFVFSGDVSVSPSVTLFAGFPEIGLEVLLQSLRDNQYMRLLAEPKLVALSGQEASFLAGGEFPIPVPQGSDAGSGTTITVEYREFGVRLRFRPTVLGDGKIRLHVAPEVSELSDVNAFESQGFVVPSLQVRRAETTLQVESGQTFGIAGLINRSTLARAAKVPGLGDLPIIGALFRSVRYTQRDTDLVILVTASVVEPLSVSGQTPVPGLLHSAPNDWELFAEGRIEGTAPAKLSEADAKWLKSMGFDKLKGAGAWATHGDGITRSSGTARPSASATEGK